MREAKGGGGEMRFEEGVKRRWRLGSRDRRGENIKQAVTEDKADGRIADSGGGQ